MTEQTTVALLSMIGVIGAAAITVLGTAAARQRRDFRRLAQENRALWYYTRHLIDWGYRPRGVNEHPPEPPESIRHIYEFGDTE